MRHPATLAVLSVIAATLGVLAFSPADPLPLAGRAALGLAFGVVALALGHRPWADETQTTWIRSLGAMGFAVGLAVVIAGAVVSVVLWAADR